MKFNNSALQTQMEKYSLMQRAYIVEQDTKHQCHLKPDGDLNLHQNIYIILFTII